MNEGLLELGPKADVKSSMARNLDQLTKYTTVDSRNNSENINETGDQSASFGNAYFGFGHSRISTASFEEVNAKEKITIEMGWKDYMVEMEKAFRSMQISLDAFQKQRKKLMKVKDMNQTKILDTQRLIKTEVIEATDKIEDLKEILKK